MRFYTKIAIFFVPILLITRLVYSQEPPVVLRDTLDYDHCFFTAIENPKKYNSEIFPSQVKKAIRNHDTLQWAKAYRLRAYSENSIRGLKYLDTAFALVKRIKLNLKKKDTIYRFLGRTHFAKAKLLYENDLNIKALQEVIKSYHYAEKCNDYEVISECLSAIADIKAFFGQENESILIYGKLVSYIGKHKSYLPEYSRIYSDALHGLAISYLHLKKVDSSLIYLNKSLKLAKENDNETLIKDLNILKSKAYFYSGDFGRARDSLVKYSNDYGIINSCDNLYYLGEIEGKLGKLRFKQNYFIKIDSILKKRNYPIIDNVNSVYQFLLKDAIQKNDTLLEKKYFNRLVYYDSILTYTHKRLKEITLAEFDLPLQEKEKQALYQKIKSKSKGLILLYVLSAFFLLGTTAYYFRYQNIQKKLEFALNNRVEMNTSRLKYQKGNRENRLSQETLDSVLSTLESWEEKKGFLANNLNQMDLAKKLGTNSTYLSMTINKFKGQNFSSYIKDLRITYAINTLKENPELIKHKSMIQLAEFFGFNSLTVFNKAFKDKLGITPGIFLKELIKSNL